MTLLSIIKVFKKSIEMPSDRNFCPGAPNIRIYLQKRRFKNEKNLIFLRKKFSILKLLLKFRIEAVAEISGNMMGTLHPRNVRRRGFMKFYNIFA